MTEDICVPIIEKFSGPYFGAATVLKILIINMARFGDLIQTIPMIMGLRKKYPRCSISLMINSEFSDICTIIPGVDDFIELDFKKVAEIKNDGIEKREVYAIHKDLIYLKNLKDQTEGCEM